MAGVLIDLQPLSHVMSVVIVPDLKTPSDDARAACLAVLASLHDVQAHITDWFGPA